MLRKTNPTVLMLALIALILTSLPPRSTAFAKPQQTTQSRPTLQGATESNLALGKAVTIVTNGADEPHSGIGISASDVTDGSLRYEPVSTLQEDGVIGYVNDDYGELLRLYVTIDLGAEYDISLIRFNPGNVQFGDHWRPDRMISPFQDTSTMAGGAYEGAWTEHTGSLRASSVTIEFRKTRNTVYQDWLFIGEIEIYEKPVQAGYEYTPFCYGSSCNEKLQLYPVEGRNIALLVDSPNLNIFILDEILTAIDAAYDYYQAVTGRHPTLYYQYNGLGTIAVVPQTCGAGCAYLGFTGIELLTDYWNLLYDGVATSSEFDHVVFYELGRNFWFYENQLEYKHGDSTGAITTGYAVFMRFMSMDAAGVQGAPFGNYTFAELRAETENMLDRYLADSSLNWANTLKIGHAPANPIGLGATDLFASFLLQLHQSYGDQFILSLWKEAATRPTASTTQDAVDNFIVAASYAADEHLADLFVNEWRWPLSTQARNELDDHFSAPITPGDGNGDGIVDAGDLAACVLEIFDGDGNNAVDAPSGSFAGTAGCDGNEDSLIDAGDLACTVLLIFNGPGSCVTLSNTETAQLNIGTATPATDGSVQFPITLTGNGHTIGAATFALTLDPSFDPTDGNGDGLPDAVQFDGLPEGVAVTATWAAGRLDVAILDETAPVTALPDGTLLTVTVPTASPITPTFDAIVTPSLGNTVGANVPVQVMSTDATRIFLPVVAR